MLIRAVFSKGKIYYTSDLCCDSSHIIEYVSAMYECECRSLNITERFYLLSAYP